MGSDGCIGLALRNHAVSPIAGTTLLVGNGQHREQFVSNEVDNTVGKPADASGSDARLAVPSRPKWPRLRCFHRVVNCGVDGNLEALTNARSRPSYQSTSALHLSRGDLDPVVVA